MRPTYIKLTVVIGVVLSILFFTIYEFAGYKFPNIAFTFFFCFLLCCLFFTGTFLGKIWFIGRSVPFSEIPENQEFEVLKTLVTGGINYAIISFHIEAPCQPMFIYNEQDLKKGFAYSIDKGKAFITGAEGINLPLSSDK